MGDESDNRVEEATPNFDVAETNLHSPRAVGDEADNVAEGGANHHDKAGRGRIVHAISGNDCS